MDMSIDLLQKLQDRENPLNSLDTIELLDRIKQWHNVDLRVISSSDITKKLFNIISAYVVSSSSISDQKLYRVRPLKEDQVFHNISEIWCPPTEFITKISRVNDIGDPMLYCALDTDTPLHECGVKEGEWFGMIEYSINHAEAVNVSNVIGQEDYPGLTDRGRINLGIINQFIRTEFTKPVGLGTEYLYRASLKLCRDLFDVPNCDGFLYPSVASFTKGYNLAVKPEAAKKKLKFDCALICRLQKFDTGKNGYVFFIKHKTNKVNGDKLEYQF